MPRRYGVLLFCIGLFCALHAASDRWWRWTGRLIYPSLLMPSFEGVQYDKGLIRFDSFDSVLVCTGGESQVGMRELLPEVPLSYRRVIFSHLISGRGEDWLQQRGRHFEAVRGCKSARMRRVRIRVKPGERTPLDRQVLEQRTISW